MNHTQLSIGIVSRLQNTPVRPDLPGPELLKKGTSGSGYPSILQISGRVTGAAEAILSTFSTER